MKTTTMFVIVNEKGEYFIPYSKSPSKSGFVADLFRAMLYRTRGIAQGVRDAKSKEYPSSTLYVLPVTLTLGEIHDKS